MTTIDRDQARFDLVSYAKALVTNRTSEAVQIEQRYGLYGLPPQLVSLGLQAAAEGRDPLDALDDHIDGSGE